MRPPLPLIAMSALLSVSTFSAHAVEYGTVVSSTPVIASVPVARQVCSEGQQIVQQRPSGAGALLGAIAGGVIGHNLGNGFGRAAATGIGAVAGSVIGDQVEANAAPAYEVPVRRCQTVSNYEDRTVGYDVMYDYAGQRYSTRMTRDPGKQIAVTVQPADAAGASVPAPAYTEPAPQAAPPPVYYQPVPRTVYYDYPAPRVYVAPVISFGFGYYGGWRGGRRW
jgi:uncharacterized protein YcfJ